MWMVLPLFGEKRMLVSEVFSSAVFASAGYIKKEKRENYQNVVICAP